MAGPGATVLRGGVFELGRAHYWDRFPPSAGDDPAQLVRSVLAGFRMDPPPPDSAARTRGLARWATWQSAHPEPLDWRDRFYWEQRVGSWLASIEQGLDITELESLAVANSSRCIDALLSLPAELRTSGGPHRELIQRMAPQLLSLPVNPPASSSERLARGVHRWLSPLVRRVRGRQAVG